MSNENESNWFAVRFNKIKGCKIVVRKNSALASYFFLKCLLKIFNENNFATMS